MLDGTMEHEDSAGHAGRIGPGDVQWMTAGAGVIHAEMPAEELRRDGGRMHGFQLWVNLPAKKKMVKPRYQEYTADRIPVADSDGATVRVVAGSVGRVRGPVDTRTPVTYLHVTLPPGTSFRQPVPATQNAVVYGISGPGEGDLCVYAHDGDTVEVTNPDGRETKDLLLLAGEPLREPVARYGPFVMNTKSEVLQAVEDFQEGRFGAISR
jgi:hypothetical protein